MAQNGTAVLSLEKLIFQDSSSGRTVDAYALVKNISNYFLQPHWEKQVKLLPALLPGNLDTKFIKFFSKYESVKNQIMVF